MIKIRPSRKYRWKHLWHIGGLSGIFLLLRPFLTLLFSRQRDLSQYSAVDASAMIFILYSFVAFFIAINDLRKDQTKIGKKILYNTPITIFLVYTIWGFVSMIWSVNLQLTVYRSFECLSMLLLNVATIQNLLRCRSNETTMQWSIFYVSFWAITKIISALSYTTDIAELLQRSQMESTCFFFIALYSTRKCWRHYLVILMSMFSMSTTAYIGMALGLFSMYKVKVSQGIKLLIILFSFGILCAIIILGPKQFLKETVFFEQEDISIENTTGRDHIMEVVLESSADKPFGMGFFAGEPYILYNYNLAAINGHNSLFSATLGTGIPGVVLMTLFFLAIGFKVFGSRIPKEVLGPLFGCFFVAFLHCMGNPGLGSRVYGGWMPTIYIFTLICAYAKFGNIENNI